MTRNKIVYVEKIIDKHGIERIYGYDTDGKKYLLNVKEVIEKYKKRGINTLREIV